MNNRNQSKVSIHAVNHYQSQSLNQISSKHSCQPAEFVIPNGGGFGRGACPLKLKKMAHMHRNGKQIVACSACAVAQNQRMRVNVDCGRWTYCVVYGTRGGKKEKKKSWIFIIQKQNHLFGNSYSNFDFLIITNNSGRLAAMSKQQHTLSPSLSTS